MAKRAGGELAVADRGVEAPVMEDADVVTLPDTSALGAGALGVATISAAVRGEALTTRVATDVDGTLMATDADTLGLPDAKGVGAADEGIRAGAAVGGADALTDAVAAAAGDELGTEGGTAVYSALKLEPRATYGATSAPKKA